MASVGIDLGDTRTTVSVILERGGRPVEARNEMTKTTTPTAIYFKDGTCKIGQGAMRQVTRRNCANTVVSIQRSVPLETRQSAAEISDSLPTPVHFYSNFEFPYVDIDDCVWKKIASGSTFEAQPDDASDTHVVFSLRLVLAIFLVKLLDPVVMKHTSIASCVMSCSDSRSVREGEILLQACEMALEIVNPADCEKPRVGLLSTSVAAAFYQARDRPENLFARSAGRACPVTFVDVGQNSTSVSVVTFDEEGAVIRAIETSRSVSGVKIDHLIFKRISEWLWKKFDLDTSTLENPVILRMLDSCRRAKEELSLAESQEIVFDGCFPGKEVKPFNLLQKDLRFLCRSPLGELKKMCDTVLRSTGLAEIDSYGQTSKVHSIELIGNGCLSPALKSVIRESFGIEPRVSLPDEFVSRGCAYYAFQKIPIATSDRVGDSYDVALSQGAVAKVTGVRNQVPSVPICPVISRDMKRSEAKLLRDMKNHERKAAAILQSEFKLAFDRSMSELRSRDRTPVQSAEWVSEMKLDTYKSVLPGGMSDLESDLDKRLTEIDVILRRIPYVAGDAIETLQLLTERLQVTSLVYDLMRYIFSLPRNMELSQHAECQKLLAARIDGVYQQASCFLGDPGTRSHLLNCMRYMKYVRGELSNAQSNVRNAWEQLDPKSEKELSSLQMRRDRPVRSKTWLSFYL